MGTQVKQRRRTILLAVPFPVVPSTLFFLALVCVAARSVSASAVNGDNNCVDDPSVLFRFKNKNRSCAWLSNKPRSKKRFVCKKRSTILGQEDTARVKRFCRSACSEWNKNCQTNNGNACTDDPDFVFLWKNKRERKCSWLSRVEDSSEHKAVACGKHAESCQSACNFENCRNRTHAPSPTRSPSASPSSGPSAAFGTTHPSAPPTGSESGSAFPTDSNNGGGPPVSLVSPSPSPSPSRAPASELPTGGPPEALFSGKKGACWTLREAGKNGSYQENIPKARALDPHWMYSWGQAPPEGVPTVPGEKGGIRIPNPSGTPPLMDFVPMLWGYYPDIFEEFTDQILDQNPRIVLGFNEPDAREQSDLSVDAAIEGWSRLVAKTTGESRNEDVLLVSPSAVNPLGSWFEEFMDRTEQEGIRVDAIGVHWYGGASPETFVQKLNAVRDKYQRPVLVTEFAVADWEATSVETNRFSEDRVLEFMRAVLPWMEDQDWILGYSWFSFERTNPYGTSSALFYEDASADGTPVLTPLGEYYAAYRKNEQNGINPTTTTPSPGDKELPGGSQENGSRNNFAFATTMVSMLTPSNLLVR